MNAAVPTRRQTRAHKKNTHRARCFREREMHREGSRSRAAPSAAPAATRGRRLTFIQEPTNARRSNLTQHYNKDHVSEAAACLSERESPLHSRCKPLQSLSQGAQTTRLSCASHMPTYSPTISPPNSQAWCRSASAHHARECNRASDRDLVISPCQLLCRKRSSTTRNAH